MSLRRREFLELAGVAVAGLACEPVLGRFPEETGASRDRGDLGRPTAWGMVVLLDKCWQRPGCNDCTVACHRAHNVPTLGSVKEEIKWMWTAPVSAVFPERPATDPVLDARPVPVLCNHCVDPPCVKVCPTKATWQRADGIVMMDYHRCIGCRYCMAGCPYGARSFNWRDPRPFVAEPNRDYPTRTKGVVEKCDFCAERLAVGGTPACVEACAAQALVFGDLNDPGSAPSRIIRAGGARQRLPELGTKPKVYYVL